MSNSSRASVNVGASGGEDKFHKHVPQYPLPNEILQMSRDETVCQFCGVSYLIHNEIKKLEERIIELEKELKNYELFKNQVKQLETVNAEKSLQIQELDEKLGLKSQMILSLNKDIESVEFDRNRLAKKAQEYENERNYLTIQNESLKKKSLKINSVVKETLINLSQQKSEMKSIELAVKDQKSMMTQYVSQIQIVMNTVLEKFSRETSSNSQELKEVNVRMEHAVKEHETLKDQIGFYMKQIEALQTAKIELHSQIEMLNNELDKARTVDSKFINVQQEKRDLMQHNSELKNELEKFKLKYFETNARFEEMSQKLSSSQENMNSISKSNELELKLKTEEMQRIRTELDSLKKHLNEKEKFEKELLNNHQLSSNEVRGMKSEIKRLNDQINNISSEREQMTIAHQCQIMQLKESFKERYRTNEDWQEKLNADLAKNREKHDADLRRLEASLKENFRIEMEIQQQKYNEMYAKYQQLSRDHGESSRAKISELELDKQRLLVEFKNLHEDKVSTEKKLRQDLESLRAITKDLHERLEKYTEDNSDSSAVKKNLKEQEKLLLQFENEKNSYENQVNQLKDEIKVLQETVHHECMERQELLEKLDETREELLNLKKQTYSSSDKMLPLKQPSMTINARRLEKPLESNGGSNNKNNLIDLNYNPKSSSRQDEFAKSSVSPAAHYPRYLGEIESHTQQQSKAMRTSQSSSSMQPESARRNSYSDSGTAMNGQKSSQRSDINSAESSFNSRANGAAAAGEHTADLSPQRLHMMRREAAFMQLKNEKNGLPTQPIQLFKKINQLSSTSSHVKSSGGGGGGGSANSSNHGSASSNKTPPHGSLADNKRRISLLIARK